MDLQAKPGLSECSQGDGEGFGLYVHVPFCADACDFCAFYQQSLRKEDVQRFLAGIKAEVAFYRGIAGVQTVFWGGGTPGLLPVGALEELAGLSRLLAPEPVEWTVELAPAVVNPAKLRVLRAAGVNRVSLGVQSFNADLLEKLGRGHRPEQARRAFAMLREAGFASVNVDMMFALPGQKREEWLGDLREALALEPDHVSTYCLTFEEDTALWVKLQQGKLRRDEAQEAALYEETWKVLEGVGYAQYEIANFARPGHACAHNLNTWRMGEWIGLGPSAASQYRFRRYTNVPSLERWSASVLVGQPERIDEVQLDAQALALDAVIFGLRMNEGVDLDALRERFGEASLPAGLEEVLVTCREEGLLEFDGRLLRLTAQGRLLADSVAALLMDA